MKLTAKFGIFALAVVLMAILACGGDDEEAEAPSAPATAMPAATAVPMAPAATAAPAKPAQPAPAATAKPGAAAPTALPLAPLATAIPTRVPPASETGTGMPKTGGTLRWVPQASIANLDPTRQTSFVTHSLVHQYYDYPYGQDVDLATINQAVSEWTMSADAMVYTFTLRDNQTFHDGAPVLASDVVASVNRWSTTPGPPGTIWTYAGEPIYEAVDSKTYTATMGNPFGLWVPFSSQGTIAYIMPARIVNALTATDIQTDYTGSGPFKFVSWQPGALAVIERNDDYVPRTDEPNGDGGARIAYLDRIEHIQVPDDASKVAALQTGQADYSEGLPGDYYDLLDTTSGLDVEVIPNWARPQLGTNKTAPPFTHPDARRALVAATNPEEYMSAGYGGEELWDLGPCLWVCGAQWGSEAGGDAYWETDMVKAQELWDNAIAETGYDGQMVVLTNTDYSDFYAAALITKSLLEQLGNEVEFFVSDWGGVISRKEAHVATDPRDGGWHGYHTWSGPLDPISDSAIGQTWNGGYHNEKIIQLKLDFLAATSVAEAKSLVDEMQRVFYEEDPATIPYGWFHFMVGKSEKVKGWTPHRRILMNGLWLDE